MSKGISREIENSFGATEGTLFEPSEETNLIDSELVLELKKKGVKFTEENLLFVTKDSSGEIVFLEKGNPGAGLEHILNGNGKENNKGHKDDFINKFSVSEKEIPKIIYDFLVKGTIIYSEPVEPTGSKKIISYKNNYISVIVADNGFVVTSNPLKYKNVKRYL